MTAMRSILRDEIELSVRTLGGFWILGPRGWIAGPPRKKGGELLHRLVAMPHSVVSHDCLMDSMPGGLSRENAFHRMHLAASGARSFLRSCVGPSTSIRHVTVGYAWHAEIRIASDIDRFIREYNDGSIASLNSAIDTYQGDFLAGESAEWIQPLRVRYACMYIDALERVAKDAVDHRKFMEALQAGLTLRSMDRSNEAAARIVMQCFGALGRREAILAEYEALRNFLEVQLGAEPASETKRLYYSLLS
jgi:DNA-binding SARP family transcriptional activator